MKTISLKLPQTLDARIAEAARRRGVSKSAVVREAVAAFLGEGRRGKGETALDAAGDLCGAVAGPGDLSHAKKHMKDFGR